MILLQLKSSFRSQDIEVFVLNFWSCRKCGLIRNLRLILRFMMSQPGQQTTTMHILHNISRIKDKQLIEYNKRNKFLQKSCWKCCRETRSRSLLFFEKTFYEEKPSHLLAEFQYILIALKLAYNKNKLYKTLFYCSRDMFSFSLLNKSLGIVSPRHFVYDFSRKMFPMLYTINWSNFIVWLSLVLEILGIMGSWDIGFWR